MEKKKKKLDKPIAQDVVFVENKKPKLKAIKIFNQVTRNYDIKFINNEEE